MGQKVPFIVFAALLAARAAAEALANPRPKADAPLKRAEVLSLAILTLAYMLSAGAAAMVLFIKGNRAFTPFALGCLLFTLGAAGRLLALRHLRASYSQGTEPLADSTLVTSGVYGIVRHPLYLFYTIETAGFLLAAPNWASAAMLVLVIGAAGYRIAVEEERLYSKYGEAHRAYRRRTKIIIPYIW